MSDIGTDVIKRLERIEALLIQSLRGERPTFDPDCRFLPKEYPDQTLAGKKFSELPSDLLSMLWSSYEHFAAKSEKEGKTLKNGKPAADWERKLADAARKWARYNQCGVQAAPAASKTDDEGELPF